MAPLIAAMLWGGTWGARPTGATIIYVATTGNDTTGDGSASNPFKTIQHGIDVAVDGDTVQVGVGTYRENVVWSNKALTLVGAGAGRTLVNGNNGGTCLKMTNVPASATVSGFTFLNGNAESGGGLYLESSTSTISHNTIVANLASDTGGGFYLSNSNAVLTDNNISANLCDGYGGGLYLSNSAAILTDNLILGNQAGLGGGAYLSSSDATLNYNGILGNLAWDGGGGVYLLQSASLLTGNEVSSNSTTGHGGGIFLDISDATLWGNGVSCNSAFGAGGGVYVLGSNGAKLMNCLVNRNEAANQGGGIYLTFSDLCLVNCDVVDNGIGGVEGLTSNPSIANCILWGNGGDDLGSTLSATYSDIGTGNTAGAGNISADPLFVGGGDYHLRFSSPCINVGNNAALNLPSIDIDGDPRIWGGTVEMGFDEFWPETQPDLWIKQGKTWLGNGVYNADGAGQTVSKLIFPGSVASYPVQLENDGKEMEAFAVKGPAGNAKWTVRYYSGSVARDDREVTHLVTSTEGWAVVLKPQESRSLLITITPQTSTIGSLSISLTAQSSRHSEQLDCVKALAKVPNLQPDLWVKYGKIWLGNGIYNTDGAGQTSVKSLLAGQTATYPARVYNDGELAETMVVRGPAGDANWTIRYFRGTSNVTSQVTSEAGWKVGTIGPGKFVAFSIKITPRSGLGVGEHQDCLVTAHSRRNPNQVDALKCVTFVK